MQRMNTFLVFSIFLEVLSGDKQVEALNASIFVPWNAHKFLGISAPVCVDPSRARESDLERVNYHDCIPILSEILLDPNVDHENRYDSTDVYQGRFFRTCSITLHPRLADSVDVFWGYQIAIAAAIAVKNCVEDSANPYGGLVFTTSRSSFYAQVRNVRDQSTLQAFAEVISTANASFGDFVLSANSTNATLLTPKPTTATAVCQVSQVLNQYFYPVKVLDCYYLFYKILTNPSLERLIRLRGLSPISYEQYGTCTLQLRGFSAFSADAITYVALLLGAVDIVQTCVVQRSFVLGGAVSVGSRGQYSVSISNPFEEKVGKPVANE